ncbi:MAG: DEAD/DEAH box helicase, partial [Cyclobacteriaceae bacterium]|nr:DEAD/DEAH box helicase [Cyclobacteriaceae bacterium]
MQNNQKTATGSYLKNLGIAELNEIQAAVVEKTINMSNLMLLAPTGSGKTLAFLIPLIAKLKPDAAGVQALIVAPSRELSLQIEDVFRSMKTSYKVSCCYGGHSVKVEQNSLGEAPAVVIGTPGRLADHFLRKSFDPRTIQLVVLDEFDKSLQMGFQKELTILFKAFNGKQHHLLTSATRLAVWPEFLPFTNPETLNYLKDEAASKLELKLVRTNTTDKVETLMRLVAGFNQEVCLVFCNHRDAVERISALLAQHQFAHGILHGAMEQIDREKNLIKFRGGAHNVLIATDLASRGLDVPEIRHVVHYQLPLQQEAFLHRNGRTARMHADGKAYLIVALDETIPEYIDKSIEEVKVPSKLVLPPPPLYSCLYISAGKKDKISKGDIVGLLTKKGGLTNDDIGLINLLDFSSYVAVRRHHVNKLLTSIKNEKLKKIK